MNSVVSMADRNASVSYAMAVLCGETVYILRESVFNLEAIGLRN